ncbi:hypothetical protein BDR07DRAFT_179013 [Suillus spraguei]|nr:hypothetical protein BDR07DRAFT_179013 [Suillus spraguei]
MYKRRHRAFVRCNFFTATDHDDLEKEQNSVTLQCVLVFLPPVASQQQAVCLSAAASGGVRWLLSLAHFENAGYRHCSVIHRLFLPREKGLPVARRHKTNYVVAICLHFNYVPHCWRSLSDVLSAFASVQLPTDSAVLYCPSTPTYIHHSVSDGMAPWPDAAYQNLSLRLALMPKRRTVRSAGSLMLFLQLVGSPVLCDITCVLSYGKV